LAGFSVYGEDPEPLLNPGDVEHFIKTFPLVVQQLEELGLQYEAESGDYDLPDAARINDEVLSILKKHGWDEHFFTVMPHIMKAYTALVYKAELPEMDRKIAEAIKEIEANPALSDAMKKQMIDQIKASQGLAAGQQSTMEEEIHPDDLAQISEYLEEIKAILENDK
jgi:hypothetical protein